MCYFINVFVSQREQLFMNYIKGSDIEYMATSASAFEIKEAGRSIAEPVRYLYLVVSAFLEAILCLQGWNTR